MICLKCYKNTLLWKSKSFFLFLTRRKTIRPSQNQDFVQSRLSSKTGFIASDILNPPKNENISNTVSRHRESKEVVKNSSVYTENFVNLVEPGFIFLERSDLIFFSILSWIFVQNTSKKDLI